MDHVVFFPGSDGTPQFRRTSSLAEAVGLVERLRNVEGVAEVSVFELTEVPLSFRPYYRVELPGRPGLDAPAVEAPAVPVVEAPVVEPPSVEVPVPAPGVPPQVADEPRSLGFFAG